MAANTIGSRGPTQAQLLANLDNAGAAEVNKKNLDQVELGANPTDQTAQQAAQLANLAGAQAPPSQMMLPGLESPDAAAEQPTTTKGATAAQATGSSSPQNTLNARLQAELQAQNQAHQAFQTAANSANVGNLISPRAAAAAAIGPDPSAGGPGGPAGPGLPPGVGGAQSGGAGGPGGAQQPGGPMGSPIGGGQYGTAGNTFTDVATRQKAIQDDLNQAQTIYTQMAADRYKWQSTMQRIWADMNTSILENIMAAVKNKISTFQKINEGIIGALFGG